MTKNFETAELLTKLTLAVAIVVVYTGYVTGDSFAKLLMILGLAVILLFIGKVAMMFFTRD